MLQPTMQLIQSRTIVVVRAHRQPIALCDGEYSTSYLFGGINLISRSPGATTDWADSLV